MRVGLIAFAAAAVIAAAAVVLGGWRWRSATERALSDLTESALPSVSEHGTFWTHELAGLPDPVLRYFEFALTPGQPLIRAARLRQTGEFARERDAWAPFTANEHFRVWPPGFVWDARIRIAPFVTANVRDSYAGGEGSMHAMAGGVFTVVDQHGTPELAQSCLLRYLAETPWLPTALLPSAGVRWSAIDDSTARATITDGATTVSMDVHFAPDGRISRISADRYRDVDGSQVLTPWEGRFRAYSRVDGMMIPIESEVGWILPDGWYPYWRGRTVSVDFERVVRID